jgi:hypothetical protein
MSVTRYFYFALVAIVLAASAFAPAQSSRSPRKGTAVTKVATTPPGAQSLPAVPSGGSPSQPQALAKACDPDDEQAKLRGAQFDFNNLRFPNAASTFATLITSCDQSVRATAGSSFDQANAEMSTWWWLEGRYVPPLRWYHHPQFWHAVSRTLLVAVFLLVLLALLFYWTDMLRWVTELISVVPRRDQLRTFFLANSLPRANIMMPSELVKDTESKLFASMLESACQDVTRVLERAGGGLQVRAIALLALPSETTSKLVEAMPKVRGVDVAGLVKFILYVKRYFGWRVESEIGYCPATKDSTGAETPARVVAAASLRHVFWVRGGPWPVHRAVQHAYDVDGVAFAIAARIMGFNMRDDRGQ